MFRVARVFRSLKPNQVRRKLSDTANPANPVNPIKPNDIEFKCTVNGKSVEKIPSKVGNVAFAIEGNTITIVETAESTIISSMNKLIMEFAKSPMRKYVTGVTVGTAVALNQYSFLPKREDLIGYCLWIGAGATFGAIPTFLFFNFMTKSLFRYTDNGDTTTYEIGGGELLKIAIKSNPMANETAPTEVPVTLGRV